MSSRAIAQYEIRTMTRQELDFAVDLAAKEGWNPGLYDADCFYAADPQGFLIGLLDGQPISCISVVKYVGGYSFLGFYIAAEAYRAQGYGYQIWQKGMAYLAGCTIGLDGVLAQVANYEKSGFEMAYQNSRFQGMAQGGGSLGDTRIIALDALPFEQLAAYDRAIFQSERDAFLKLWISRPEALALGIQSPETGDLLGYAVGRKCRVGFKIAPLFADTAEAADLLLREISGRLPTGTPIFLDSPAKEQNPAAWELVQRYGMSQVFSTARMYRLAPSGKTLNFPLEKWFGVTSFELG